ncbi:phospholipid-binding protein [Phormidesmis priestleyi ULC007]|uniref:Phospholipid-binding protein n=1 Tax=Phormidesmis priestleyi ULC007 TaxID=1920490 RepID=A0A2T1DI06_9CYAN|nr:hypothetical protein [Phormidesmis priestleyi]PSB20139.1 phospholipid-binding protein [Phormidesmis priestleyi ULC007]PZO49068.1 MAG: phospholipid-binding protein [Phormidesmis priestleyi]
MNSWVQPSNLTRSQPETECISHAAIPLFRMIPPERVGLNGEYDHNGLANRVILTFREQFEAIEIAQLSVFQRGRVIILLGQISNCHLLTRLVSVALAVYGASTVETHGLLIVDKIKVS